MFRKKIVGKKIPLFSNAMDSDRQVSSIANTTDLGIIYCAANRAGAMILQN
jgi:hypothetical protein